MLLLFCVFANDHNYLIVVTRPVGGDVLGDIDNMLQGLTDELDAMLEEELS